MTQQRTPVRKKGLGFCAKLGDSPLSCCVVVGSPANRGAGIEPAAKHLVAGCRNPASHVSRHSSS